MHQICIIADPSAKHIRCQLIDLSLIGLDNQSVGKEKLHDPVRAVPPVSIKLYKVPLFMFLQLFSLHAAVIGLNMDRRIKAHISKMWAHICPWQKKTLSVTAITKTINEIYNEISETALGSLWEYQGGIQVL